MLGIVASKLSLPLWKAKIIDSLVE